MERAAFDARKSSHDDADKIMRGGRGGGRERDLRAASEDIKDDDEGDVGAAAGVALHVEECDVARCLACA